eukprot:9902622-Heterocapsa_arctica.AAC.1
MGRDGNQKLQLTLSIFVLQVALLDALDTFQRAPSVRRSYHAMCCGFLPGVDLVKLLQGALTTG